MVFLPYIDELVKHMNKIDIIFLCLLNTVVANLLYADNVVLLCKFGVGLQRLLNKLYEFCTSLALKSNYLRLKS